MKARSGGCLCGAARFIATPTKETFGACHCDQCRKWTGGPMLSVTVADARWEGPVRTFRSSGWAERGFCADCGSTLFYRVTLSDGPHAGETHVAFGAFDDPSGLRLDDELFADRPAGAYAFAGAHRRLTAAETIALFTS